MFWGTGANEESEEVDKFVLGNLSEHAEHSAFLMNMLMIQCRQYTSSVECETPVFIYTIICL